MVSKNQLGDLKKSLRKFAADRDWDQFHSPKNLATALSVETSEVLEHFQWLTNEESLNLPSKDRLSVALELADVLLYLIRLADKLEIDLVRVANDKLAINAENYPISKSRGSAKKYTDL